MPIIHSLYSEAGKVEIVCGTCKNCGQCARTCPGQVLVMEEGHLLVRDDGHFGCIACGHCMMVCPEDSIRVTGRGLSHEDLLPLPAAGERATADELTALMAARRSVRRFKDEDVDPEALKRIVDMASSAPMGIPPWDIGCVIVRGKGKVHELAEQVIKGYEGFLKVFRPWVLAAMRPFMRRTTYDRFRSFIHPLAEKYAGSWREGKDVLFYDAPAVLVFHHSPYADAADAAIACTYAMLAAESLGLGTTMIGGAAPIIQRNKGLCRKLGIPEGNTPAIALIVGHPAVTFRRALRRRFTGVNTLH
jgi:Fe-S-cluster-containing hydrogenase component 2